jgi:glucose-6-phosphate isomerase
MQLPDETLEYQFYGFALPSEVWTPLAELQAQHLLAPARVRALLPLAQQVRGQIAAERELQNPPPELRPLDAGFIDLPQKTLEQHRKKAETSDLGRVAALAQPLREQVDRVVILGAGGSSLGARALFQALCNTYHNELPPRSRMGVPRVYFEGDAADNDALQDLLDLLETTCVDPDLRDERWGVIVVSKSGATLETATAYRVVRKEAAKFYGTNADELRKLFVPVTGSAGRLRDLVKAQGFAEEDVLTVPENVGGRYAVFSAAGLLPAAVLGLDVRALLLGAAAMTRRFLEEPFERNPVLQYAAVNYLMAEELGKRTRVLAAWSKKLEALGRWYDHLLAESLGKQGRGPTPVTVVHPRDLHARGQQFQDGRRDVVINNLVVKAPKAQPIAIGMADRNEDDLNQFSRRTLPDVQRAALVGTHQAYAEAARPAGDLVLPALSEHALGQLMQMLMLATVVEARLMGVNPYGQPGVEAYKHHMRAALKGMPNPVG